ncbi:hypothetical protein XELAEV_18023568mg [Xenopus laevis]|uniref:Uncharacterized protein n=1 Tax=Xenopus laevis TaxID=8355 RepID=A0A974D6W9_XENLA|nr:hypothetical protein XELAEV_18023568mg [Xenopus laevis]
MVKFVTFFQHLIGNICHSLVVTFLPSEYSPTLDMLFPITIHAEVTFWVLLLFHSFCSKKVTSTYLLTFYTVEVGQRVLFLLLLILITP